MGVASRGIIQRTGRTGLAALLVLLLFAAINVPLAVMLLKSRRAARPSRWMEDIRGPAASSKGWPVRTPHHEPWPPPDSWECAREFGYREYDVRSTGGGKPPGSQFQMHARLYGWPLPVLEEAQFWWDWSDPALGTGNPPGPVSDPPMRLRWSGVILNPLIGAAVVMGAWGAVFYYIPMIRAAERRRAGKCEACGYPVGVSPVCTECGATVQVKSSSMDRHSA